MISIKTLVVVCRYTCMESSSRQFPGRMKGLLEQIEELKQRVATFENRERQWRRRERAWRKRDKERLQKIQQLEKELEEAKRKGKRSASPFSKGKKKNPKRPGRKPDQGSFKNREEPEPTEPPIAVPQEEEACACGGVLEHDHVERVTVTDLPEIPEPVVKAYDVEVSKCASCGKTVRGRHEDVAPDQYGATAHRVGPRARAMAHVLHYGIGVTVRKVPKVLKALSGLDLTQSAITQDALKQARGPVGAVYGELREAVQESDYVHTDDTGWRIAGEPAQLMVFETTGEQPVVVYQIRRRHRNEEVRELLPADYAGTATTDRGTSYDAQEWSEVKQNKCVDHLKRNIKAAQEKQPPGARSFGNRLLALIREAEALWRAFHEGDLSPKDYRQHGYAILDDLAECLSERTLKDPENQRLLKGLAKQNKLGHLLRFLEDPNLEPSNNRAERALRLCVIIRKVSHCSKTDEAADAQAGFQSVIATLARRGRDVVEGVTHILRGLNPFTRKPIAGET